MKIVLWDNRVIQPIRNKSSVRKEWEISGFASLVTVRGRLQLQHQPQPYVTHLLLVKSADIAENRLQCNWFNLVLAERNTSEAKEAFLEHGDVFVPFNYSSIHSDSTRAVNIQGMS